MRALPVPVKAKAKKYTEQIAPPHSTTRSISKIEGETVLL